MKPKVKQAVFERQLKKRVKRLYWERGYKFTQRKKQYIKIMQTYWKAESRVDDGQMW